MKSIRLTGVPVDTGSPFAGCAGGPTAMRAAGLIQALEAMGHHVIDTGDIASTPALGVNHPNQTLRALSSSAAWVQAVQQALLQQPGDNNVEVFLGGDHLMSAGTIPPLALRAATQGRPLFCLWLDAHTDFHNLDSTDTGNLHGTPAAYVCGQPGFAGVFPKLPAAIDSSRLCMVGVRSVDDAELEWLKPLRTRLIGMYELKSKGIEAAVQPFLEQVHAANGLLHLSFDVDCLDPIDAPGVGTAVDGGVRLDQAHTLMTCLNQSQLVSSVDIAELNPKRDASGRTAQVMVELMARLFSTATIEPTRMTTAKAGSCDA